MFCFYSLFIGAAIFFAEFSPFVLENHLVPYLPFMATPKGRSILYLVTATFLMDSHMGRTANFTAVLLLMTSAGWVVHDCLETGLKQNIASFSGACQIHSSVSKIDFGKYVDKKPAH
jgi:hypothetical protein